MDISHSSIIIQTISIGNKIVKNEPLYEWFTDPNDHWNSLKKMFQTPKTLLTL